MVALIQKILPLLQDGKPARLFEAADAEEEKLVKMLNLITTKPILYVCNTDDASVAEGNEFTAAEKNVQEEGCCCAYCSINRSRNCTIK